jgi:hypothetical protein
MAADHRFALLEDFACLARMRRFLRLSDPSTLHHTRLRFPLASPKHLVEQYICGGLSAIKCLSQLRQILARQLSRIKAYKALGNVVLPDTLCEAVFSYTVPLDCVSAENTRAAVTLIAELVSRADFSHSIVFPKDGRHPT